MENSNAIFDAQMQNKEFKAAVLNQLEELSNKNAYEFKIIKSIFKKLKLFFYICYICYS
jgi:hypothetical protein